MRDGDAVWLAGKVLFCAKKPIVHNDLRGEKFIMARKYGFKSGYVEAINQEAEVVTVPDDSTSLSVTFDEAMENAPVVVVTATESGESPFVDPSTVSETGFTVDGLSDTGANDVQYIAFDPSRY